MLPYFRAFPVLDQVYLEDSWVLHLREHPAGLVFELDAVMTERHPAYRGPLPGERYDYRRLELAVVGLQAVYEPSGAAPAVDGNGDLDHGNIDAWHVDEDGWSHLEGTGAPHGCCRRSRYCGSSTSGRPRDYGHGPPSCGGSGTSLRRSPTVRRPRVEQT